MTERKIAMDLAREGWCPDDSDEDSDVFSEDLDDLEDGLYKQMRLIFDMSKVNKSHYDFPRICLVLTRVSEDCSAATRKILDRIRSLGVSVQLASKDWASNGSPAIPLQCHNMTIDPRKRLSVTLNVDCTILLAFISDLSHGQVEAEHWHHKFLARQMEMEKVTQLLPESIWPACASHPLVCTREAAVRMDEIVNDIGTVSERERARLLFRTTTSSDSTESCTLSLPERLAALQTLSRYDIPADWRLPIEIVDVDVDACLVKLPEVAREVSDSLSALNRTVFMYGWAEGISTISSNRQTAKDIKVMIESRSRGLAVAGPHIWLSPTSRSLVGKEKRGSKSEDCIQGSEEVDLCAAWLIRVEDCV